MRKAVRWLLLIVVAAVFLISAPIVIKHQLEMRDSAQQTETLTQMVVTRMEEVEVPQEAVAVAPEETQTELPAEPMEESVEEIPVKAPIHVDFTALQAANPEAIAWLYSPDTPIHYPVAQAADNDYYLHRLLDGRANAAGTLFMDYRNTGGLTDWNSVIYGHNMIDDSMFGSLPDYKSQSYYEAHPDLYLLTPERDYLIKLFAGFVTSADAELYQSFNPTGEERIRLMESWKDASDFVSEVCPTEEDRLITLSTCSYEYDNARYVLIGVLN